MDRAAGPSRVRAAVVGLAAVALAVVAHAGGGGALPGPTALAVVAAPVAVAAVVVGRRRRSAPVLAAVLGAMQVVLHGALSALGGAAACSAAAGLLAGSAAAGHAGHGAGTACGPEGAVALAGLAGLHGGPLMLAAHAVATLASALLLTRGERLLELLTAAVLPAVPTPLAPLPGGRPGRPVPRAAVRPTPFSPGAVLPRRGPPLPLAAAR